MATWADHAICYQWMHERTERIFKRKDYAFMFPVIILSTITGAANFAIDGMIPDPEQKKMAQMVLGGVSIATGIISTIANRLGYASGKEAHHSAAQLWGKFQRLIAIELSLHPNERMDCMQFLKMCRTELDRLIEQSPTIPESVIKECSTEFKKYPTVKIPSIVGNINTTNVFVDSNGRLKEMAKEAAITIAQKKGVLKQLVLDDIEPRINRVIEFSTLPAMKEELKKEVQKAAREAVAASRRSETGVTGPTTLAKQAEERAAEVKQLAMSGVVSEMKRKLAVAATKYQGPLPHSTEDVVVHIEDESDESDIEEHFVDASGGDATGDDKK